MKFYNDSTIITYNSRVILWAKSIVKPTLRSRDLWDRPLIKMYFYIQVWWCQKQSPERVLFTPILWPEQRSTDLQHKKATRYTRMHQGNNCIEGRFRWTSLVSTSDEQSFVNKCQCRIIRIMQKKWLCAEKGIRNGEYCIGGLSQYQQWSLG